MTTPQRRPLPRRAARHPMHPAYALGPRIRHYRPSIHLSHALPFLGCGPLFGIVCILGGALGAGGKAIGFGLLLLLTFPLITGLVCAVHWSAYLDLHEHGLIVGRSVFGGSRPMRYSEIHPATVRVFTKIDNVRGPFRAQILMSWHFTGGANLAATFLGPHPFTALTDRARPPQPGPGIVLFGSRDAVEIAAQIRAGLERAGCPPHLARWSQQFEIERVEGPHSHAEKQIPGMHRDWEPGAP